ncbi:MAG: Zn-dependent hydrolase [Bacteroidales bacterium]|nr:Zn-dependent hydrolase [Bacteroidales bacterium]
MNKHFISATAFAALLTCMSCNNTTKETVEKSPLQQKVEEFASFELTADISHLSANEKELLGIFIDIAKIMDDLFWQQSYGDKSLIDTISNEWAKRFAQINYGPWDRLGNMAPFIEGYGEKPAGACFYPADMTKEEFEQLADENKESQYTVITRDNEGKLQVVWYKDYYKTQLDKVCELLEKAINLTDNAEMKKYLETRLQAFKTDNYFDSDMAWMDMKNSNIDFVVGPIENYEDKLFGRKTAYEAFVLIKDLEGSKNLSKFITMLPSLQQELPCDAKYKQEVPGTSSDLNVYNAVYYAGDCNSGSKTIAINLPNDERVHLQKGSRRLQLKNAMMAKFDKILVPIANVIVNDDQLDNVKFDAFFWNVTFHEVAHGLGIKNTITNKGTVRVALGEQYSAWEEAKADILGLFMVQKLIERGEITNITVEDAYVTFIAGILRSVRFGTSSAHGNANLMCFNSFEKNGAFYRDENGKYIIDMSKAQQAMEQWAALILQVEGDGDIDYAIKYYQENSQINDNLKADLEKIANANIPRDIDFIQGKKSLGLE